MSLTRDGLASSGARLPQIMGAALRLVCSNPSRAILDATPTSSKKHAHLIPRNHRRYKRKTRMSTKAPNVHKSPKETQPGTPKSTRKTRNRAEMSKAEPTCP